MQEVVWPGRRSDNLKSMILYTIDYALDAGTSVTLLQKIFAELARLYYVIALSQYAIYIRHGSVEVRLRNDVHGSMYDLR